MLKRALGARDVVILTLSALSPAASIYITGAGILHMAGTGAAAAVMLGGAVTVVGALLYAELGGAFPQAGGVYPGISRVLGPGAGFVAMTLGLVTTPAILAFISLGFADYVRVLAPGLDKLPLAWAALGLAGLFAILDIRTNAWITGLFLAAEMLAVVILATVAGLHPARGLGQVLLHPVMLGPGASLQPTPLWTMILATLSGAFACSGATLAIYFSEEVRGAPSRVGGLVAFIGALAPIIVGLPLVLLATSMPALAQTLSAEAPIARYLQDAAGPAVTQATTAVVALAILNNVIASTLGFSRFLYSTGRDRLWPAGVASRLSSLDHRFRSPWAASIVLVTVAGALCLVGEGRLLVVVSGEIFTATMVAASVLVGRTRGQTGASTFRSPAFPILPILGFAIVATLLTADWRDKAAGRPSLILLAGVAACAFAFHRFRLRRSLSRIPKDEPNQR